MTVNAMVNVEKALDNLDSAFERIKNLLAWQKLKQTENAGSACTLNIGDGSEELYNECVFFDYTADQIERTIESDKASDAQQLLCYKNRLKKLRKEFSRLNINTARYPSNYTAGI